MNIIVNLVAKPLEWLNLLTGSYAAAVALFTVIINLLLLPLRVRQQRSMAGQAMLKPKLEALKERCGDDRQKYSMEMSELYRKNNVSMTGGCLTSLIQLPLLMLVYYAIQQVIASGRTDINFMLFGIDLSQTPQFNINILEGWNIVWLIPFLSFATAMLSSLVSMAVSKKNSAQAAGQGMGAMLLLMPVMSLWIAFKVTAALGFYWACSNLMSVVTQLLLNRFFHTEKMVAEMYLKQGKIRRKEELAIMERKTSSAEE